MRFTNHRWYVSFETPSYGDLHHSGVIFSMFRVAGKTRQHFFRDHGSVLTRLWKLKGTDVAKKPT